MIRLRSLRWHIVVAAVLWTIGLLPVGHMLFLVLTGRRHEKFIGVFHIGLSSICWRWHWCFWWPGLRKYAAGCCPLTSYESAYRLFVPVMSAGSKGPIRQKCSHWSTILICSLNSAKKLCSGRWRKPTIWHTV